MYTSTHRDTCTHREIHRHTCAQTHMHTHVDIHTETCMHTHIQRHTCTDRHRDTDTRTYTETQIDTHTHIHIPIISDLSFHRLLQRREKLQLEKQKFILIWGLMKAWVMQCLGDLKLT